MAEASRNRWLSRAKWLFKRVEAVGRFITRIINLILVAVVYFVAIGPVAVIFRIAGRDILETSSPPDSVSLWHAKAPTSAELEHFRRQF